MASRSYFILLVCMAGMCACHKTGTTVAFEGFQKPGYFPDPVYHFSTNPVTKKGFELGRRLFYDPILSANNTISCANCHIQTSGFTQHGHSVSHGIFDRVGTRNSPPIMNLAWSRHLMWDGGVFDLDLQPIAPITNHVEMDDRVENVLERLRQSSAYPALFQKAYGTREISTSRFLQALSQFMLMCVSANAKYDSVMRGQAVFTPSEQAGYIICRQKCGTCHTEPLFTDQSFRNNGLSIATLNDQGRYAITLQDSDRYKFKVPSLRNLAYTAPYMHDGRFFTLDAVLDHYARQVEATPNLDPLLREGSSRGIFLSAAEREKLVAFISTLNDRSFVTDNRFSEN